MLNLEKNRDLKIEMGQSCTVVNMDQSQNLDQLVKSIRGG